ncbi:class I SAM-dependent methyltransferase [Jannaschia sp. CCS1]|uniref:class I SAM-dependent methyltransferase n=1 Tax=Jannaschia sp. (strain CCS1) TaxID=290400 RepID=UPI00006BFF87|nr:class I SAM-dependent methyltransferase [Jannaschia sp. CCS1]ABD53420.1 Methyltransferase type 11 [Jannaschia sp. CCS1]
MSDDQTLSVYGDAVDRYTATPMEPEHIAALDHFAASVRPGGRVLDLGCGPGLQAETLVAAGLDVDAVDATPAFVEAAQSRGLNARIAVFEDLPGAEIYYGIWASFSLLHARRDTVSGHVARLAGALSPGGIFFLGMKTGTGEARDGLGRFYSYFSVEELHQMLEDAGLRVTQTVTGRGKGLSGSDDTYALVHAVRDA